MAIVINRIPKNHSRALYTYSSKISAITFDGVLISSDGEIPYDGKPILLQATVKLWITVMFSILASVGIVFSVACLIFNFVFRNAK